MDSIIEILNSLHNRILTKGALFSALYAVMSSSSALLTDLNEMSLSIFSARGMWKKACRSTIYHIQ